MRRQRAEGRPGAEREAFTTALRDCGGRAEHRGVRLAIETESEPAEPLAALLRALDLPALASSIDAAAALLAGVDPIALVRTLAHWVVHAYASDAVPARGLAAPNLRGPAFPPGALDWEEYFGALEEIDYRGFLTIWPPAGAPLATAFKAVAGRLEQIG